MKSKTQKRKRLFGSKRSKLTKRNHKTKKRKNYKIIHSKTPIDIQILGEGMSRENNSSYASTISSIPLSYASTISSIPLSYTSTISSTPNSKLEKKTSIRKNSSYAPTINEKLVTIRSIPRSKLENCNNQAAFEMKEPIKIGVGDHFFHKACFEYFTP
jgi:hypothetical protein